MAIAKSCVLQVQANGERLLLTGDIDRAAERAFLDSPLAVRTDWLQAPRHGSRSSSSWPFLQAAGTHVSADLPWAWQCVLGHPHPQVVERYQALGSQLYDSAEHGAVRLQLGAFLPPIVARSQRRFWREALPVIRRYYKAGAYDRRSHG